MMNSDLLYFCTMCLGKSPEQTEGINCEIEHKVKNFKKGEYIAFQGEKISSLYMLIKGKVKTEIVSPAGLMLSVEEICAPYPLAAAFLFADNNHFPVDVIAQEPCEVILISKSAVEKQIALCCGFLRGFIAFTANRTQFLSERLRIFSQRGLKAKLSYYILQIDDKGTFELGRSISSLAEYFATDRPSLSRAISEMAKDGVIEFDKGNGKILNYSKIKELLG